MTVHVKAITPEMQRKAVLALLRRVFANGRRLRLSPGQAEYIRRGWK